MANTPKKPVGRPPEEFDLEQVELFGRFKATYDTMSSWFGVSTRTIERLMSPENLEETEFCRSYKKGMADLQLKLSEAQIRNALVENNATLQVWLGKQYLNQKDKQEIDSNIKSTNTEVSEYPELKSLSEEELKNFHELAKKARGEK